LGYRVYVTGKDPATNTVTVGSKADLMASGCVVGEANWLVDEPSGEVRCWAKYRYNTSAAVARVRVLPTSAGPTHSGRVGRFEVEFEGAQEAVAAGQAVVLYAHDEPDRVLGGGWIEGVNNASGSGAAR
jgi:tRNA-specific 2-thiouridylase